MAFVPPRWEFRIFGPLEVVRGGPPFDVSPLRQRALLALLVVEANRVVSFDRLIDELWGTASGSAGHTAHAYVYKLRRALKADVPGGGGQGAGRPGTRLCAAGRPGCG